MASQSDRTVNKVAMCGAIFAGVAYVGYKVVKKAFEKKSSRKDGNAVLGYEPHRSGRIYLRRLSGTECTAMASDVIFENGLNDGSRKGRPGGGGRGRDRKATVFFRPLSVQQRIRELNLTARHFAETVLAVHLHETVHHYPDPLRAVSYTQSLQASPTHSHKMFAPIEITQLGSSRCSSNENLTFSGRSSLSTSLSSSLNDCGLERRPWSRSSHRRRNTSSGSLSKEELNQSIESEGERLLDERECELKRRLQSFENGTAKILTPYEVKSLVALLHTNDRDIMERALHTVSNSSAFAANQDMLRDSGCMLRLQHLNSHPDRAVKIAAITATGNMALNVANQRCMDKIVPGLLEVLEEAAASSQDNHLVLQALLTLTNVASLNDWHSDFVPGLQCIWSLTQSDDFKVRVQSLRLLVNLSTNDEMTRHLMDPHALGILWTLIDIRTPEDELLRAVAFFANVIASDKKSKLLSFESGRRSPNCCRYGLKDDDRGFVLARLAKLMLSHPHEDVRAKARNVLNLMKDA